jgi:hypothetical protein
LNGQTPSITVVDNNPRLLQSLENLLESASYAVRMVSSAEDLLNAGLAGVVSEVTVRLLCCNVIRKMQAASIGNLIRAWEILPASLRSSAVNCSSWPASIAGHQRRRQAGRSDTMAFHRVKIGGRNVIVRYRWTIPRDDCGAAPVATPRPRHVVTSTRSTAGPGRIVLENRWRGERLD